MVAMISACEEIRSLPHLANFRINQLSGIYCFIHRQSGLHYVGSSVDIGKRLSAHVRDSRGGSTTLFHRALRAFGLAAFDLEVLEECPQHELQPKEAFYIAFLNAASIDGLNCYVFAAKSRFGTGVSEATRQRISASLKGRKGQSHSVATRALIGEKSKGRYFSPEVRARMSEMGKRRPRELVELVASKIRGLKRSEETRKKQSLAFKGKKKSPEHRAKLSAAFKGRKLPKEWKEKLLRGVIGRVHSQATKDKRAAHHIGAKRSPGACERMRLAQLNMSPEKKANIDRGRRQPRSEECKARMRAGIAAAKARKAMQ